MNAINEQLTTYKRNVPSVSRFRFTRLEPKCKNPNKIGLFHRRKLCLRIWFLKRMSLLTSSIRRLEP